MFDNAQPDVIVETDGVSTEDMPMDEDFAEAFDHTFDEAIDVSRWVHGEDLGETLERTDREVAAAIADEERYRQHIRNEVFTTEFFAHIQRQQDLPIAGKYAANLEDIERVQAGLLFNGGVEACDGTNVVHDTLPLTVTQIGVCLVTYKGTHNTYSRRLYRRDLRSKSDNPVGDIMTLLARRRKREAQGLDDHSLSRLARRSVMTYAERAILAHQSTAPWRMGHGNPAPYELLTNFWTSPQRMQISLDLIRWYVEHERFVFVPSAPRDRHLLTLGYSLEPLEYLIVGTLRPDIDQYIERGHYRERSGTLPAMKKFRDQVSGEVVVGLYRVSHHAPPYLFYAHVKHADMAAHIVMADSLLQEHRGFPLLIDLADALCKLNLMGDRFFTTIQTAYADAGMPYCYFAERETRDG